MSHAPIQDTDPTLGKLVMDAQRDVSSLISQEIALAKGELKLSVRHGGLGAGLFAGAAFLAVLAIIMLSVSIAYFIHLAGLGLHWSFLIVFAFYVLVAALLAFIGLKQVKKVKAPEKAIEQGKQIPAALKGQQKPSVLPNVPPSPAAAARKH